MRIPSALSVVAELNRLTFHNGDARVPVAIVSLDRDQNVLLELNLAGRRFIGRGDLLQPTWRGQVATDFRLLYSKEKEDRTRLLGLLNELALAWHDHLSRPMTPEDVLKIAQQIDALLTPEQREVAKRDGVA